MSDHPKATVLITILVIAAALFAGIVYVGRPRHVAVDNARSAHAVVPGGGMR